MIWERLVGRGIALGLTTHVTLTAFENSPDAKVSFGTKGERLAHLPQWRFFAPTPGTENTHLVFRTRAPRAPEWQPWEELSLVKPIGWLCIVWNPGSRGPKALFDCVQHLKSMGSVGAKWEAVTSSAAYQTVSQVIGQQGAARGADAAQFMIVASRLDDGAAAMQPILVSDPIDLDAASTGRAGAELVEGVR
ncbi:hypothetical protein [Luteipulveratus flavus]|uniref:Uncharacterized protein n=1 Tax=Luteipulveratus flavus TaxID=3031728 RepID=A0ABT6C7K6_9MICO|nr:hypothetical protein [Luteipulveratus sp. YIM 133296]MDF8264760.1 hypothetical protein [Luteipulveratus sp. YIM 133296]